MVGKDTRRLFVGCENLGMAKLLWRRYTEWPLVVISLVFLMVYSIQVIANLSGRQAAIIEVIVW